jgi:uncharacterized protein Yka (UPF0111/DUF47 family)
MKRIFKVHSVTKTIYLPSDLRKEGFDGELEGYMNAATVTLVKPGIPLDQAIESLETVIQDLRLRQKMERNVKRGAGEVQNRPEVEERLESIENSVGKLESEFDKMRRKIKEGR